MSAPWSRLVRLGLVASTAFALVGIPRAPVWAQDDDDEEDGDDDDEDGDDEEEEQPPVTAGGLFTKATYPIAELQRPLTITKGMSEMRLGIDVDVSAATAFEKWGLGANYRYGLEDNVELQADLRSDLNQFSSLVFRAGIEAAIVYDLVDFRFAAVLPYTDPGGVTLDFEIGFPFRYAPKPQVGIIALDTFMTINTEGKPDLTPSVGIIVQPVDVLAIKLQAKLIIVDFNTDAENFQIPVSANIQFSPSNLVDIGGEFTFPNLKPPEPAKFYDIRMLLLYGQLRF